MRISKELLKGSTSLLVLKVISEEDSYGYEIVQRMERLSRGTFQLKEGTLYPILHTMEKEGLVEAYRKESAAGRERRYYRITASGKVYLAAREAEWREYAAAVNAVLDGGA